jgi:hypothetical protein
MRYLLLMLLSFPALAVERYTDGQAEMLVFKDSTRKCETRILIRNGIIERLSPGCPAEEKPEKPQRPPQSR